MPRKPSSHPSDVASLRVALADAPLPATDGDGQSESEDEAQEVTPHKSHGAFIDTERKCPHGVLIHDFWCDRCEETKGHAAWCPAGDPYKGYACTCGAEKADAP